jgi:hypothetical protein
LIVGQSKISGNWRKFHASVYQIPESQGILIFSREIPALRACAPPEIYLESSFDQTKNQRKLVSDELIKAKLIDEDPDFEGSELREDLSSCAKKLFFRENNHICTELF